MIRFLSPGFAWALAAPAVVVILYMLRRKHVQQQVPSVFLWQRSVRDYAANRPLRRLMKTLLFLLQLLAALALAFALMRPVIPGSAAGNSVMIFDISGSMQAENGGRTRLETAKEKAVKLIREMPAEEKITVITAGDEAKRLVLDGDRETAEQAVMSIRCGRGGADFHKAMKLAEALMDSEEDGRKTAAVTVFSDALRLSDLNAEDGKTAVAVVNVGEPAENRAIYSLTAEKGKAYARIANYGGDCSVTVVCEADGTVCGASTADIPAGETTGVGFDLPEGTRRVRVYLREKDALAADNSAEAAVKQEREYRVAVTEDSVFLESALRIRPDLTVIRTEPEAMASAEADLWILGSDPVILTTGLPEGGFDPEAAAFGPFAWNAEAKSGEGLTPEVMDSPLTAGMTMSGVFFRSIRPVTGGRTAVKCGEDPVIAWSEGTIVIGFDLHDTNLPLKYDFPILIQNILKTLLPEAAAEEAGEEPMAAEESDTRDTAPSAESAAGRTRNEQGRDLTGILLVLFLVILLAETAVSRVCTAGTRRRSSRTGG